MNEEPSTFVCILVSCAQEQTSSHIIPTPTPLRTDAGRDGQNSAKLNQPTVSLRAPLPYRSHCPRSGQSTRGPLRETRGSKNASIAAASIVLRAHHLMSWPGRGRRTSHTTVAMYVHVHPRPPMPRLLQKAGVGGMVTYVQYSKREGVAVWRTTAQPRSGGNNTNTMPFFAMAEGKGGALNTTLHGRWW